MSGDVARNAASTSLCGTRGSSAVTKLAPLLSAASFALGACNTDCTMRGDHTYSTTGCDEPNKADGARQDCACRCCAEVAHAKHIRHLKIREGVRLKVNGKAIECDYFVNTSALRVFVKPLSRLYHCVMVHTQSYTLQPIYCITESIYCI